MGDRMNKKEVRSTKGDSDGTIDSLIDFLQNAKREGATLYEMDWSHDPQWAFKWFRTYQIRTDEEVKQDEIKELEQRLDKLKRV
jgi:hypothetical protein